MADEAPKIPEAAAAKEQVKAAPAAAVPAPAVKAAPKPEPEPDRMTVRMANATNGAGYHGHEVTVDAETGRALIRAGEASPAT